MSKRLFLVPVVTREGLQSPKYEQSDGLNGWSGTTLNLDAFDLPLSGTWYMVWFYGPVEALDTIESQPDAYTIDEQGLTKADLASYLNDHFGTDRTFTEWLDSFGVQ